MTEKENKAIDLLKFYEGFFKNIGHEEEVKSIESIINYIEKLQKEAEETQPIIEVLENLGKNGLGEYSKRYFAEYRAIHHTAFYDFIPDPDEIYKKYYEQKKEIEKLKKENEDLTEVNHEQGQCYCQAKVEIENLREKRDKYYLLISKIRERLQKEYDLYNSKEQLKYSQDIIDVLEELLEEE